MNLMSFLGIHRHDETPWYVITVNNQSTVFSYSNVNCPLGWLELRTTETCNLTTSSTPTHRIRVSFMWAVNVNVTVTLQNLWSIVIQHSNYHHVISYDSN